MKVAFGYPTMFLHVQFCDYRHDFVETHELDKLIELRQIKQFYRPSEGRWIDIGLDQVRRSGGHYAGPERRRFHVTGLSGERE
jgi:hypothetical protein